MLSVCQEKIVINLSSMNDKMPLLEDCALFNSNYELDKLKSWVEDEFALFNIDYEVDYEPFFFQEFFKDTLIH